MKSGAAREERKRYQPGAGGRKSAGVRFAMIMSVMTRPRRMSTGMLQKEPVFATAFAGGGSIRRLNGFAGKRLRVLPGPARLCAPAWNQSPAEIRDPPARHIYRRDAYGKSDQEVTMATIDEIDTMRDNRDVDGLIGALQDPDEFVRAEAALSLGTIADPKAKEPLLRMRSEDPSGSVREAAATAYKWVVGRLQEVEAARGSLESRLPKTW